MNEGRALEVVVENLPQMGSNGVVNISRIEAVAWRVRWASSAGVTGLVNG